MNAKIRKKCSEEVLSLVTRTNLLKSSCFHKIPSLKWSNSAGLQISGT